MIFAEITLQILIFAVIKHGYIEILVIADITSWKYW